MLSAGCAGSGPGQPEEGVDTGANWTATGGERDEAGYRRLEAITPGNVGKLGLAWFLDLPDEVTLEATPLAVDGTLYFSGSYARVYAVDALTGKLLWRFDPETWKRSPNKFTFVVNRDVAYEDGRIFVAEMDGRVDALDEKTGNRVWSCDSMPPVALHSMRAGGPRQVE